MAAADFTEFFAWRATAAHNASMIAWMVESEVALKRLVACRYSVRSLSAAMGEGYGPSGPPVLVATSNGILAAQAVTWQGPWPEAPAGIG